MTLVCCEQPMVVAAARSLPDFAETDQDESVWLCLECHNKIPRSSTTDQPAASSSVDMEHDYRTVSWFREKYTHDNAPKHGARHWHNAVDDISVLLAALEAERQTVARTQVALDQMNLWFNRKSLEDQELRQTLAERDKEIARLREALQLARQYVAATHGVVAGAAGHNNLVLPDLEKVDAALAGQAQREQA